MQDVGSVAAPVQQAAGVTAAQMAAPALDAAAAAEMPAAPALVAAAGAQMAAPALDAAAATTSETPQQLPLSRDSPQHQQRRLRQQ